MDGWRGIALLGRELLCTQNDPSDGRKIGISIYNMAEAEALTKFPFEERLYSIPSKTHKAAKFSLNIWFLDNQYFLLLYITKTAKNVNREMA